MLKVETRFVLHDTFPPSPDGVLRRARLTCGAGIWMVLVLTCMGGTASDSSAALASPLATTEDDLYASFNPAFITRGNAGQGIDLSRFETGNFLPAGVYRMDIFVNANWVGRQSIRIINQGRSTRACLKPEQLRDWGVAEEKLKSPQVEKNSCLTLDQFLPEASLELNGSELEIRLSVPQAFLARQARGYVDPVHWDGGMAAAFLGYNVNAFQSRG